MIQIDDTLVALDIIEENFFCDLSCCKGACCIEGDSGAPLEADEINIIQDILPIIWKDLSSKAQELITRQGIAYKDEDDEMVTSIINGKDCVFTYYDDKGICKCTIEKAYREKKINFMKPISCHLYPIRIQRYKDFTAVNYNRWKICKPATALGNKEHMRIYQFLKEPLIRKFGENWYNELNLAAEEYHKIKHSSNK